MDLSDACRVNYVLPVSWISLREDPRTVMSGGFTDALVGRLSYNTPLVSQVGPKKYTVELVAWWVIYGVGCRSGRGGGGGSLDLKRRVSVLPCHTVQWHLDSVWYIHVSAGVGIEKGACLGIGGIIKMVAAGLNLQLLREMPLYVFCGKH